ESSYCSPSEITFYDGTFIQTDPRLPSYPTNYIELGESFVSDARTKSSWYRHEHVLIPFGCDFAHQNAYQSMIQMDKLMEYINSNHTYNATVIYSTFADYVHAVHALNLTWNLETNDFFTYDDSPHAWWTGYFTSRPQLKEFIRSRENVMRPAEQWFTFAKNMNFFNTYSNVFNETAIMNNISYLRHAIDSAQHHDGVSGTATQHTTDDYMYMLQQGTDKVIPFTEQVAPYFLKKGSNIPPLVRNESLISSLTNNNVLAVVLYNSLAWLIPSNISNLVVFDATGEEVLSQINPVTEYAQPFHDPCTHILFFKATMAPLSFSTFFVKLSNDTSKVNLAKVRYARDVFRNDQADTYTIGTGYYTLTFTEDQKTKGVYLTGLQNNGLKQEFVLNNTWIQYAPTGGIYSDGLQTNILAFRKPFNSTNPSPGFIVAAHGEGQYYDTFVPTVCAYSIENAEFTYRYWRADGSNWGQNPSFDFLVFDSNEQNEFNFDDGQTTVCIFLFCLFILFLNYYLSDSKMQLYRTRIMTIKTNKLVRHSCCKSIQLPDQTSNNQFPKEYVCRRTFSCGVCAQQQLQLWSQIKYNKTTNLTYLHLHLDLLVSGKTTFIVPAKTTNVIKVNFTFNSSEFVVNEPVVLYSLRQLSPDPSSGVIFVATTAVYNSKKGFGLNVFPETAVSSAATYEVSYVAFERGLIFKSIDPPVDVVFLEGPLVSEMQQVWQTNYSQTYRVFNGDFVDDLKYVDVEVHLGPMDQGAEFVTRWRTSLDSSGVMYTCQNALEYVERTYNPNLDERLGANYYPTASQTYISDSGDDYRFATIVNQAHGVASLRSGEMELMLHRRCLSDDGRGVGEVLNETTHIEPRIFVTYDASEEVSYLSRRLHQIQHYGATKFYGLASSISSWTSKYGVSWTAISSNYSQGLPSNIHLQELRYAYNGLNYNQGLILQLQHMFEVGENAQWSVDETINLSTIFNPNVVPVNQVTEMTLTANLPLANLHKLQWNIVDEDGNVRVVNGKKKTAATQGTVTTLSPRQIRTFVVNEDLKIEDKVVKMDEKRSKRH
ncbi:hypothetical protein RFI_32129, partial [Reticulomyxa filosa]